MDTPDIESRARRHLRRCSTAVLEADGVPYRGSYTLGPSGRVVMPVPIEATLADEFVLMIPDDSFDAMQILALLDLLDAQRDPACDRYLARFGPPHGKRWSSFRVEAIKWEGAVIDGTTIDLTNPLAPFEPTLLRRLNADPESLLHTCLARGITCPETPVAVGIDPDGFDVRSRYLVARIAFDAPATTHDDAIEAIRRVLESPDGPRRH